MVWHLVLMKARPDLDSDGRRALAETFARACRRIPTIREVRVGRRVAHGAAYEAAAPDIADFVVALAFDDVAGLQAYLRHTEHEELGRLFGQACSAAAAYDFEVGGIEMLSKLVDLR
jgi:stress responsive alpha/beta barrel protein